MKRVFFNKKGQSGGEETPIGTMVGVVTLIILLYVGGAWWGFGFDEKFDASSLNSYSLLADDVGRVWQNS